jgi:predicted TIM-barrel fold metal-dependent hydrolase
MTDNAWSRRAVLAALAGAAGGAALPGRAADEPLVPWSSALEPPHYGSPPNATDCHHHIYDSRFPVDPQATLRPGDATVPQYRQLQKLLGLKRNVIVQPSTYGVDNSCLLDALSQFGLAATRGVAVVNTEVSEAELKRLDAAGVRGIRFNLAQAGATTIDIVEPLSRRVDALGWHIQVNAPADRIVAAAAVWERVPCAIVFDHLAHVPEPAGVNHPVFGLVSRLLQRGKAWVKISGAYADTKVGPPTYADSGAVAMAYIKEAPERLVWGSDWPHPTEKQKPDDTLLYDLLADWTPGEKTRRGILVDNPARLYGFT